MPPPPPPGSDPGRRMGLWMFIGAWVLVLLLGAALFQDWFDFASNPNQAPRLLDDGSGRHGVVLAPNRSGHYVVSGSIDGVGVQFLLDTGATIVAVPAGTARAAGLRPGAEVSLQTANGIAIGHVTRIDRLQFGNIELRAVRAVITPNMAGDEVLLGMSALRQLQWRRDGRDLVLTVPD